MELTRPPRIVNTSTSCSQTRQLDLYLQCFSKEEALLQIVVENIGGGHISNTAVAIVGLAILIDCLNCLVVDYCYFTLNMFQPHSL